MVKRPANLPQQAEIVHRDEEAPKVFSLHLRFTESSVHNAYHFYPGQFNMVYLFGVGEVPISIVSDPRHYSLYQHTVRIVGRITQGLSKLKQGDKLGIRGPYGHGWPMETAKGKDVVIITGGIGCAPTVSAIRYMMNRRHDYGRIMIVQGVKHSDDLLFRPYYEHWAQQPDTEVRLTADKPGPHWPWDHRLATEIIHELGIIRPQNTVAMMCGPEGMMLACVKPLVERGLVEDNIYLSMERNMECALGHCGHCQFGGQFICKDGPVFAYPTLKPLLGRKGF